MTVCRCTPPRGATFARLCPVSVLRGDTVRHWGATVTPPAVVGHNDAVSTPPSSPSELDRPLAGLDALPVAGHLELLAAPVAAALAPGGAASEVADLVRVLGIDPDLADTAAMCSAFDLPLTTAANCVVVAGTRAGVTRYAACVALATTRVDVNTVVRRRLDARRASFAPMDDAVRLSGMAYGGITPVGLPSDWALWIDAAVAATAEVVIGSGVRHSKLILPGAALARLPGAEVVGGLAKPFAPVASTAGPGILGGE